MGCLSGLKFWKKKSQSPYCAEPAPRPYDQRLASAAARRQYQPPTYPPATYDEKVRYPLQTGPYAGEKGPAGQYGRWTPANVSSPQDPIGMGIKEKDEGVDDPAEARRKRAAEEAKRKAEREEQERLDFFQML